MPPRR